MKNFFKGISISSISAGALAAVTSFLMSAKIGIAGSVIGVAAGSIVSAVATQVYKNVLKASGEKLQNAVSSNDGTAQNDGNGEARSSESDTKQTGDETAVLTDATSVMPAAKPRVIASGQDAGEQADAGETRVLGDLADLADVDATTSLTPVQDGQTGKSSATGKKFAGAAQVQHAGKNGAKYLAWLHGKHAPIIIAVVSALVGVGISAGLILAFTGGQGTDTVVRDAVHHSKSVPSQKENDDQNDQTNSGVTPNPEYKPSDNQNDGESENEGTAKGDGQSKDTSKDESSNSGTSGTTNGANGNSNGSSSGNSSGSSSSSTPGGSGSGSSSGSGASGGSTGSSGQGSGSGSDSGTSGSGSGTSDSGADSGTGSSGSGDASGLSETK